MNIQEKPQESTANGERIIPLIALRGKVLFPNTVLNFDVGRPISVNAVNAAAGGDKTVFIATQKSAFIDAPLNGDILDVGVIARINQVIKTGSAMKVTAQAICRAKIKSFTKDKNYFEVIAEEAPFIDGDNPLETEAHLRLAKAAFSAYLELDKRISKEIAGTVISATDPNVFMDNALSIVNFPENEIQPLITEDYTVKRLEIFRDLFIKEAQIVNIEKQISAKVRSGIDKSQKEFFLREQIKAIHQELGDDVDEKTELKNKIEGKNFPQEVKEKALEEIASKETV